MASKSIGILLPDLRGGGAERVAVNLANGFLSNGLVVEVVLMSYEGIFLGDLEQDIRVVNLQSLRLRNVIMPLVKYLRHRRLKPRAVIERCMPRKSHRVGYSELSGGDASRG